MKHITTILSAAALMLSGAALMAQTGTRTVRTINDRWNFTQEGRTTVVNIPHTWNADDTWDEAPGFYRGECTYQRTIRINDDLSSQRVYIRFEGADQTAEVIVNGKSVGKHVGGYTAFCFDITDFVVPGENDFLFKIDNSHNVNIPPLEADFTFYGGIYRDVDLIFTPKDHISTTHYASSGVYISTPSVSEAVSDVSVETHLTISNQAKYVLTQTVYDPQGTVVATAKKSFSAKSAGEIVQTQALKVQNCKLWDVDSPNVYRVVTTLCTAKGKVIDSVENPMGFRTWSFDAKNGFTLNGRHLKLMGTNRHQDYNEKGNALTDEMHVRDIKLLKDMGGNYLRIAHYPQDPIMTQCCDREGIACSVEIPIINYVTESEEFKRNCVEMAKEMVYQDFNHPSVIIWAYMNEILLRIPVNMKDEVALRHYFDVVCDQASAIDEAIKAIDHQRNTMVPCHGDPARYFKCGIGNIPDIIGWNYYNGWYSKTVNDFAVAVEKIHEIFPDKPFILTEYGAGVDPRLHSRAPRRFDFSAEYGLIFHKYYVDVIKTWDFIAGSNVWNLNDFYAEPRIDAVPHVNNKGLVGLDRVPKDTYRVYQANLSKKPVLVIGGKTWTLRAGNEGEVFPIEVYTNDTEVTLTVNGREIGSAKVEKGVAAFEASFKDGENVIFAKTPSGLTDVCRFNYAEVPSDLKNFKEMNVMLGSDRYFQDEIAGAAWMPEQEYRPGSWGYVGGASYNQYNGKNNILPCSSLDILGTINDPVYQSQRVGLEAFKADVPDGEYFVYLYFAELNFKKDGKPQPFNLGNDAVSEPVTEREFDVDINGRKVLAGLNLREQYGAATAVCQKFTVRVENGQGLTIGLTPVKGTTVLNAVRIYRCW